MDNLLLERRHVHLAVAMMGTGGGGNLPMRITAPRLAHLEAWPSLGGGGALPSVSGSFAATSSSPSLFIGGIERM